MKGVIRFNSTKSKYELMTKDQKKRLVTSKNINYLKYLVTAQQHKAILKYKITDVEVISSAPTIVSSAPTIAVTDQKGEDIVDHNGFSIEKRFGFTEQLITMVVNKTAKSVLITGQGAVGKTHTVLKTLKQLGKVDVRETMPSIEDFNPVTPADDEKEIEEKVLAAINRPSGDYIVIKGYISAKHLYRTLFENRTRTVVFDDCDSVLKDPTMAQLLKSALDSYEERWVTWGVETPGDTDLPSSFRFQGSIIFVSNMPLNKVDEAVRTRCFKVDVTMTKAQRIERMYAVLDDVMPDVDLEPKLEALNLIEKNISIAREVNFRSLMNVISIRVDPSNKDWTELAKFALTEY